MELLTTAQMRAIEKTAMASGRVTCLALMERAGQEVVAVILERWSHLNHVLVICGPGSNGGDGYVVARLLRDRGWTVRVASFGDSAKASPEAAEMRRRWEAGGGEVLTDWDAAGIDNHTRVFVDAGLGIGFHGHWGGHPLYAEIGRVHGPALHWPRIAIDLPTGVEADTGAASDQVLGCDVTVTFQSRKWGHVLAPGAERCGEVVVRDIGLDKWWSRPHVKGGPARTIGRPAAARLAKPVFAHKYGHGHAVILSGPAGAGGAARLAARGALRVGAGLVTLLSPPDAMLENAARLDAIMLRPLADPDALAALLADDRIGAVCLGPGLGLGTGEDGRERVQGLVATVLAHGRGVVLDADALSAFSGQPLALRREGPCRTILTPHEGEFARLFAPGLAARVETDRAGAVAAAAEQLNAVVLLKGPVTVIAEPDGRVHALPLVGPQAAPWLATAGAGDVLAGLITGLLARGLPPAEAACTGAWLHAAAARRFGPGLIAEDLPDCLPGVFRELGL